MRINARILLPLLSVLLVVMFLLGAGTGAMAIAPAEVMQILLHKLGIISHSEATAAQEAVVWAVRLPRVITGMLIGAGLAVSGACMQGLFRNPLADPGLIGISAGASFFAALAILFGANMFLFGSYSLPLATFFGAALTAFLVYRLSRSGGKTLVSTMLLAGIAVNALVGACTGFLTYMADEAQLRDITFWLLGSLGGATWSSVLSLLPFVLLPLIFLPTLSKSLNVFALGEGNAACLGTNVSRLKTHVILLSTMAVGASVAVAGMIGFVGLVIPHVVRMMAGPDHKTLLPASGLLGASLLVGADLLCRTLVAPAELPIGIITAIIGTPLFLSILLREKRKRTVLA